MQSRKHKSAKILFASGALLAVFGVVAQLRAAGVPETGALTYTGYLETPDGKPVTSKVNINVNIWDAEEAGNRLCEQAMTDVTPVSGRFQIALPDPCTAAVKANPNLWIEVQVGGASLGRTKIGAVPYALEAGRVDLTSLVHIAADFKDVRLGPLATPERPNLVAAPAGTWVAVPQRTLTFTKKYETSKLKITYQDTLGNQGTYYNGCNWRIVMDGKVLLSFSDAEAGNVASPNIWHMSNAAHVTWSIAAAGKHTVSVQWQGGHPIDAQGNRAWVASGQTGTSECLAGWNSVGGFLSVEEIP